jgi:hypothetical protein
MPTIVALLCAMSFVRSDGFKAEPDDSEDHRGVELSLAGYEVTHCVLIDAPPLTRLTPFFLRCGVSIGDLSAKLLKF